MELENLIHALHSSTHLSGRKSLPSSECLRWGTWQGTNTGYHETGRHCEGVGAVMLGQHLGRRLTGEHPGRRRPREMDHSHRGPLEELDRRASSAKTLISSLLLMMFGRVSIEVGRNALLLCVPHIGLHLHP